MPADRVIRGEFWKDERVLSVPSGARLLFLWLIASADADGIAPVTPCPGFTQTEQDSALWELSREGLVAYYSADDVGYAWVPKLPLHQPRAGKLKPERDIALPAPPPGVVMEALRKRLHRPATRKEMEAASPRTFGKKRAGPGIANRDVKRVFDAWAKYQKGTTKLGRGSQAVIKAALGEATPEQLVGLVRFAYEADEAAAKYWRGGNRQRRTYLGLDNLMQLKKLASRLQLVVEWEQKRTEDDGDGTGYRPGPLAQYRNRKT